MDSKRIKVTGYAASELDIQTEVLEVGDLNYGLLAQWTGSHVVVFDREHAERLAGLACDWGNDIDRDLTAGQHDGDPEGARYARAIARGLWGLSERLYGAFR